MSSESKYKSLLRRSYLKINSNPPTIANVHFARADLDHTFSWLHGMQDFSYGSHTWLILIENYVHQLSVVHHNTNGQTVFSPFSSVKIIFFLHAMHRKIQPYWPSLYGILVFVQNSTNFPYSRDTISTTYF